MAYDTASSQGYAAAAAAQGGGPFQNSASIFFGQAEIGGSTLTSSPTLTPSSTAQPSAALGDVRAPAIGVGAGLPSGGSGFSLTSILLVGAVLLGGVLVVHMINK